MRHIQNKNKKHFTIRKRQHDDTKITFRQQKQSSPRVCKARLPYIIKKQSIRQGRGINIEQHLHLITMQEQQEHVMRPRDILVIFCEDLNWWVFLRVEEEN